MLQTLKNPTIHITNDLMVWLPETVGQRIAFAITLVYGSISAWGISNRVTWFFVMALLPSVAREVIVNPEGAANWVAHKVLIPIRLYDAVSARLFAVVTWCAAVGAWLFAAGPAPWPQPPHAVPEVWPFHDWDPLLQQQPPPGGFPAPRGHRVENVHHCACLDERAEALERELLLQRAAFFDLQDQAQDDRRQLQEEINLRLNTPRNGFVQQREMLAQVAALQTDLARTQAELAQARGLIRQHLGQGQPGQG
ncbi:hypothetical protein SLS62_010490 [Diatrype stigma]|uniref:Uncharacterized protein n=1 Tax=Diatrype stigma TaxID=117547 RepID=A0AAN9UBR0_9PEZI